LGNASLGVLVDMPGKGRELSVVEEMGPREIAHPGHGLLGMRRKVYGFPWENEFFLSW
jgi:hypothetical protein